MYQYPLFMTHKPQGLIVMFTNIGTGVVLEKGTNSRDVGETYYTFTHHTVTSVWTPCADPRQTKKQKLMVMLKDFR